MSIRRTLFDGDDELPANAVVIMTTMAGKEGRRYNGWHGLGSPAVRAFIAAHGTAQGNLI